LLTEIIVANSFITGKTEKQDFFRDKETDILSHAE